MEQYSGASKLTKETGKGTKAGKSVKSKAKKAPVKKSKKKAKSSTKKTTPKKNTAKKTTSKKTVNKAKTKTTGKKNVSPVKAGNKAGKKVKPKKLDLQFFASSQKKSTSKKAANPVKAGKQAKGTGNGYKYWNKTTEFKNVKVYQRDDIINPNMKDAMGRTNLERMKKGLAPLGPDGKSINLHHTTQRNTSSIAEVTQTFHKENSTIIHINPNTIPSGINRKEFNKWRTDYWKNRANDF